jgi:hypothetical protein
MATQEQIQKLAENWSPIIKQIYPAIDFIPKGDPDTLETLLANWEQAPPGFTAPTEQQLLDGLAVVQSEIAAADVAQAIEDTAQSGWDNIPNWATWTAEEAETWIETNVTNFAEAKVVLKKQAVAIMWLADKVFPNRR